MTYILNMELMSVSPISGIPASLRVPPVATVPAR